MRELLHLPLATTVVVFAIATALSSCLLFDFRVRDRVPIKRPQIDMGALRDCSDIEGAVTGELAYIRFCLADSQCGTPLQGTSCGCTRDLVARSTADSDRFYDLLDLAGRNQCSLDMFVSTCDCPPADGFVCIDHVCQWNYTDGNVVDLPR